MRLPYQIPFWKQAPLVRLLIPLSTGIVLQWYLQCYISFILLCMGSFALAYLFFHALSSSNLYMARKWQGAVFYLFVGSLAMLLVWQKDSRHRSSWYGNMYSDSSVLLVKINEPLIEKPASYRAEGGIISVLNGEKKYSATGKILLYFSKDSAANALKYGDLILVKKNPEPIRNSGNPGAFDFKRYEAFQQTYQQVFLTPSDWACTHQSRASGFYRFLYLTRAKIISNLHQFMGSSSQALGIAEALLIGYKEDLDRDLVQAYSNTGVVHIIAISGLHLGLIYAVLLWVLNRLPLIKNTRHFKVILLLGCLWFFSLLTGASASVLRSAVMFTVIIIGKYYFKKSSIYNSLSASAFLLLCYNPYLLWDVGFQLSYLAVVGIVALQKPLYRAVYVPNVWLRKLWEMIAITLAAQVAAFPICLYYFHQFPNMFLFTNLLVVPLSTVILFGEILLLALSPIQFLAAYTGKALTILIHLMNSIIMYFSGFSFSVADKIYATIATTLLLYGVVAFFCAWLIYQHKKFLTFSLICLAAFAGIHALARIQLQGQQKMVVYNVPKHRAVDFIASDKYVFVGDSILAMAGSLQNFHLKPARTEMHLSQEEHDLPALGHTNYYWQYHQRKMIFLDSAIVFEPADRIIPVDLLLLSHNANVKMKDITRAIRPAMVVMDASNSLWKIEAWKKECEELLLRSHSVSEQGAYILNLR